MQVIDGAGTFTVPVAPFDAHWVEQFRVPDLSVGTYSIPAGGTDDQEPHTEDEVYVVTAGQAAFEAGGRRVEVGPGAVIFVPAGEPHRFADITADLAALVLFGPAEGSRAVTHIVAFVTGLVDAFNSGVASGDFARLLELLTDDAVVRFESVPGAKAARYPGREAYTAAYLHTPPDDQLDLAGDPREEEGAVLVDFTWRRDRSPGLMRLFVTDDDRISAMALSPGNRTVGGTE
jgi:mannose-6-phosphate isomerase-like protein (cupin superfamily)